MEQFSTAEGRRILKRYLSQYYRAKDKQAVLRKRLEHLQAELRHPGVRYTPPKGIPYKPKPHIEAASLTIKISDIEDRIRQQANTEAQSIIDIMDMIEFLPADTLERDILEYRHIDCKSWSDIMKCVHLTRSPCFEYYNRALDKLLEYKKVRATLSEWESRMERNAKNNH